jgi:hypothetical protein
MQDNATTYTANNSRKPSTVASVISRPSFVVHAQRKNMWIIQTPRKNLGKCYVCLETHSHDVKHALTSRFSIKISETTAEKRAVNYRLPWRVCCRYQSNNNLHTVYILIPVKMIVYTLVYLCLRLYPTV